MQYTVSIIKTSEKTQLQVRIDTDTKNKARKILSDMGLDASTAVNILFKQIVNKKTFPFDIRDINGFTAEKARELRGGAVRESKHSKKTFRNSGDLIKDLMS